MDLGINLKICLCLGEVREREELRITPRSGMEGMKEMTCLLLRQRHLEEEQVQSREEIQSSVLVP